ncbi:hypothetical protein CFOL_v3_07537 [Cephalotus follicularis]|uniref:DUF1685 domain-containing protein n=1 Tax=Cephalotus follicularis TaxID=3775 RepID=A0A1Q3B7W5_CEPFO|nr:hypothetical protein CFOL_v3_07537 [Cephalotus follicularis]
MDPIGTCSTREAKVDDLLEEGWFFCNLLDKRNIMSRCYCDPSPLSEISKEMLAKNANDKNSSSNKRLPKGHCSLIRAPSLPSYLWRGAGVDDKERKLRMSKLTRQKSQSPTTPPPPPVGEAKQSDGARMRGSAGEPRRRSLLRTPSLPPSIGREEDIDDDESHARLSNLIRQALPDISDISPLRRNSKGMAQSYSMPRNRPPRKIAEEVRHQNLNLTKHTKSLSHLEAQEVQGFKDLGFTFDNNDLNPSVVSMLHGLQEKNQKDLEQDNMRRPYTSEAWLMQKQSCANPIPNCVVKQSSPEDMKAQIKFWARAVASNVR